MLLTCESTRARHESLLAGCLSESDEVELIEHLDNCPDCRRVFDELTSDDDWNQIGNVLREGGVNETPTKVDCAAALPAANIDMFVSWLSPSDDPESLGRIGNMEIRGVIGHGGAGVVYKGYDSALGRNVAIKLMNPSAANQESARTRFARESRAMAAITHEHVVPVYAVASHNDLPYLVMEYVPGGTLARRIQDEGPLETIETVRVGLQIAQGLAAAHRQGVVHRDVKPSNILLDPGVERVRVTDFGLARAINDQTHTESGTLVGTPQFMSPEQVCSENVDGRSDLFSLGSVLYNCCTGRLPFEAESIYATMQKISHESAPSAQAANPNVPEWLDNLIRRLHQREPSQRIASAGELAEILEAELLYLQQPESAPKPERKWQARPQPADSRFSKRNVILVATALIAGLFAVFLLPTGNNNAEPMAQLADDIVLDAPAPPEDLRPELQEWVDRIVQANEHKAIAFGIGPELVKLPPDDAVLVARAAWPKVRDYSARRGILKAFQFSTHPQVVTVMHLGMTDGHEEVRSTAEFYLRTIALRSFEGDMAGYAEWYEQFGEQPLSKIFEAGYLRLSQTLKDVDAEVGLKIIEGLDDDFGRWGRKSSFREKREAVRKSGIGDIVLSWCYDESLELNQLSELGELLKALPLTETQIEQKALPLLSTDLHPYIRAAAAVTVAKYAPDKSREALLSMLAEIVKSEQASDALTRQRMWRIALSLSWIGDPQTIPELIAIMDSDNSPNVRSEINRALTRDALGEITGVTRSPFHDGPWWRRWWKENRDRMPHSIRTTDIKNLPKTKFGMTYKSSSADMETYEGRQKIFRDQFTKLIASGATGGLSLSTIAGEISEQGDPRDIPFLIGAIDADNSYETIYGVGYFGLARSKLGKLTGVDYSPYHDGAWWRRWWEANKKRFSKEAQQSPIAEFPKTKHGKSFVPFPPDLDTHEGRVRYLTEQLKQPNARLSSLARLFSDVPDPRGIPVLIAAIDADTTGKAVYDIGYYGLGFGKLGKLTKVKYDESHDAVWWKAWWATHKNNFPTAAAMDIPTLDMSNAGGKSANPLSDVADVSAEDRLIDGDKDKRYFLVGDPESVPESGFKLAIILPGGNGGEDFHPFVRRIYKHALNRSWLVAQPVAVQWSDQQQIVWPKQTDQLDAAKFTTEEFVDMVIADVQRKHKVDPRHIVTLSWSSSGPAAYATALRPDSQVTGSYIAMSVFRSSFYQSVDAAKGRRFVIDHSPDDNVCPYAMSVTAEQTLMAAGAKVKRLTYSGGHGWHGNLYARIKEGMTWLAATE